MATIASRGATSISVMVDQSRQLLEGKTWSMGPPGFNTRVSSRSVPEVFCYMLENIRGHHYVKGCVRELQLVPS